MHDSNKLRRKAIRMAAAAAFIFTGTAFAASASAETIRFAAPPWPGVTVKTEVASQILQGIGYETEVVNASTSAILQGIANKQIHAAMALWRPQHNGVLDPMIEKGKVTELVANLENTRYQNAVPKYVWDAGVRSMADLHKYPEKFNKEMYGLEAGMAGNKIMWDAVKNDIYGLKGWKVIPSSESGMLAQVKRAISRKEWVVFQGWEPHWMNVEFDMKYLEDPENIWGGTSTVYTVAHPSLAEEHPNVARFLSQMTLPKSVQSDWILEYSHEGRPADEVAREWIASNRDMVDRWLEGVVAKGSDQPAAEALSLR